MLNFSDPYSVGGDEKVIDISVDCAGYRWTATAFASSKSDAVKAANLVDAANDMFSALLFVRKYIVMQQEKMNPMPTQFVSIVTKALAKAEQA